MAVTESRSLELRSVAIGAWALALFATALRAYTRVVIMKGFGIDDWLMMASMVTFTVNTVTCVMGTTQGSGMHMADLTPDQIEAALMWWYACYPTIAICIVLAKLSVGFYLLRITSQRLHRWIIYLASAASVLASTAFFFVTVLQCQPISYAWNKISETGTCIPIDTIIDIMYAHSAFTLFTDVAFTLLPAWLVYNLQMNLKTKLVLVLILSMACIASTAVVVRFPHIKDFRNPDFLWAATTVSIWSQVEAGLAIAAGSFATLRPLYRILLLKLGLTTENTASATTGPNSYGPHGGGAGGHAGSGGAGGGGTAGKTHSHNTNKSSTTAAAAARNMFSMTTFSRMDDADMTTDDDDDDDSTRGARAGARGGARAGGSSLGSTADLHSKGGGGVGGDDFVVVVRKD